MNENGVVNVYLLIISFVLAPNSEAEDIINVDEEMRKQMAIEMENVVDYSSQTRSSGESLTSAREEDKKIDY